jgi:hypothetical protein
VHLARLNRQTSAATPTWLRSCFHALHYCICVQSSATYANCQTPCPHLEQVHLAISHACCQQALLLRATRRQKCCRHHVLQWQLAKAELSGHPCSVRRSWLPQLEVLLAKSGKLGLKLVSQLVLIPLKAKHLQRQTKAELVCLWCSSSCLIVKATCSDAAAAAAAVASMHGDCSIRLQCICSHARRVTHHGLRRKPHTHTCISYIILTLPTQAHLHT